MELPCNRDLPTFGCYCTAYSLVRRSLNRLDGLKREVNPALLPIFHRLNVAPNAGLDGLLDTHALHPPPMLTPNAAS